MKKTLMLMLGIFGLFLLSSSFNTSGAGIKPGMKIPEFSLENSIGKLSNQTIKGSYSVITFWDASRPEARLDCSLFKTLADTQQDIPIKIVGVNIGSSEKLFYQIVKRDNLNPNTQYFAECHQSKQIISDFMIERGVRSLLVDPNGIILAVNPRPGDLARFIKKD